MSTESLERIWKELRRIARIVEAMDKRFYRMNKMQKAQQKKAEAQAEPSLLPPPPEAPKPAKSKPKKKELPTEVKQAVKNGWALWVDVHRKLGWKDPIPVGPDTMASAQLAKSIKDPAELSGIMEAYLQDEDRYLVQNGHALRYLPARINAYRAKEEIVALPAKEYDAMAKDMAELGDAPPARFKRIEEPDDLAVTHEPLTDAEQDEALGDL